MVTESRSILLIWICAAAVTLGGWFLFYFTTDDAYIIFRYLGQRQAGNGYV